MEIINITEQDFEREVLNSDMPVLVDFWAVWCGPCKAVSPIFESLSKEYKTIKFVKVNVDEQKELAAKYKIMSIPTILVFYSGILQERIIGARSKNEYKTIIEKYW